MLGKSGLTCSAIYRSAFKTQILARPSYGASKPADGALVTTYVVHSVLILSKSLFHYPKG
jgi:hypothetical protein